eukprot:RCo052337
MRRGMPTAMDTLPQEEGEEEPSGYDLSASGEAFRFKGIAGMYTVTPSGLTVTTAAPALRSPQHGRSGMPVDRVNLRCNFADLDLPQAKLLGAGASGKVYSVKHKPSGLTIAVKRISVGEEQHLQQIKRELDTLYAECHDHIITFYGAFFDHGDILIALERMDGSLHDCLSAMQKIPETVLRGITKQVLKALVYLHKTRHVVHRDVKPSNLLFSRDGSIKITDFGISAALVDSACQAHTFVGTVQYMSPERLSGAEYSYPVDIWSLGCTLIQLATGRHPYSKLDEKANFWEVLQLITNENSPELPPDQIFSRNFRNFVQLCVVKDPAGRGTAAQLLEHPFVAEMSDADAVAVCREWMTQVRRRLKEVRQTKQQTERDAVKMLDELLGGGPEQGSSSSTGRPRSPFS